MSDSDLQGNTTKTAGGTGDMQLIKVNVDANPGLSVKAPKKKGGSYALGTEGIKFCGTVKVAETAAKGDWSVGWIQTIYPCGQSVTYQNPAGTAQAKMTSTVAEAEADGISQEDTRHWAWSEHVPDICQPGESVTASADDQPNMPFREPYDRDKPEWIKGWKAIATSGSMQFCTWLVAEAPTKNIEYLYHVVWHVDFGARLKDGAIEEITGKLAVTGQGEGKGPCAPCLSAKVIDSDEHPYLPDQDL